MKSKRPFNAPSVLMFAVHLIAHVCGTQFASHVSVNTPARSFTHGVGDPLPTPYQGFTSLRRPSVRLAQRSHTQRPQPQRTQPQRTQPQRTQPQRTQPHRTQTQHTQSQRIQTQRSGGYPRVQPVVPFNSEEIRGNGLNSLSWSYDIQMETSIPVLPPSPYKVDSPDPESLWPEGLFLPPLSASRFGGFGRRTDLEPEIIDDPYLLEGSEAIAAVKRARDHGIYYFHDIPHIESLFANQDLRVQNGLRPHRVASIRHTWPYNRP